MQIHRGELTQEKVEASGLSLSKLATRLGVSRKTIYNWFDRDDLPLEYMLRIGSVIGYDFRHDLPELSGNQVAENAAGYGVNWRNKYFEMLEENHKLSSRYIALVEKKLMEFAQELGLSNT